MMNPRVRCHMMSVLVQGLLLLISTSASLELVSESTFCREEFSRVKQNSGFGIIHSPNLSMINPCCSLEYHLCPGCRIHLTFPKNKTFHSGLCKSSHDQSSECESLDISDSRFCSQNNLHVTSFKDIEGYVTTTNRLFMKYCYKSNNYVTVDKFVIKFEIFEQATFVTRHAPQMETGSFTSAGFPVGYLGSGDKYTYYLHAGTHYRFIELSFNDWNFSPQSRIIIYANGFKTKSKSSRTEMIGSSKRPFIISSNFDLTIEFYTGNFETCRLVNGTETRTNVFMGFNASYLFLDVLRSEPRLLDDRFFSNSFGDSIKFDCKQVDPGVLVDYIWAISTPPSSVDEAHNEGEWLLRIDNAIDIRDDLEIRRGNNSAGSIVEWRRSREYKDPAGFYIRLRTTCRSFKLFRAVFTWTYPSCSDFFCKNRKDLCLNQLLVCDGVDNCGDRSDEISCDNSSHTPPNHRSNNSFPWMTPDPETPSSFPERNYRSTRIAIPVIVAATFIVIILVCLVVAFILKRKHKQRALIRAQQNLERYREAALCADYPDGGAPLDYLENNLTGLWQERLESEPSIVEISGLPTYQECITDTATIRSQLQDSRTGLLQQDPPPYSSVVKPLDELDNNCLMYLRDVEMQMLMSELNPPPYESHIDIRTGSEEANDFSAQNL